MINKNRLPKSRSTGTKLSPEQYAAVESRAHEQDLGVSAYVRQTLLAAHHQPELQAVLMVLLQELLALRSIVVNVASEQVSGAPLTAERFQAVRANADTHKAARARTLLAESGSNNNLAVVSEHEEAA